MTYVPTFSRKTYPEMSAGRSRRCHGLLLILLLLRGDIAVVTASVENASSSLADSGEIFRSLLKDCDPGVRPDVDGPPVVVRCGFFVVSFGPFSDINMDYQLDIYLRQTWVDPRLTFRRFGDSDHVLVSAKSMEHVWKPDLFFRNGKSASFHRVTAPNKLMRIYNNGTVLYSTRITLTLACTMNLRRFPMDHQRCSVQIESYSYETNAMQLEWDGIKGVSHEEDMDLPQFRLLSKKTTKTSVVYKTGTFPGLTATFELEHLFGFFLLQTYIPTILIVILAWVSFWVNLDAVPARISLGVTTVLTMATQLSGCKESIPNVHYPKAIDIWMTMCMLFVFVSLVEFAFVNALSRDSSNKDNEGKKKKECENYETVKGSIEEKFVGPYVIESQWTITCGFSSGREAALFLERVSQICFPIAFIIFNVVYWSVYLRPYEY
ncbi:Glycine receptor subunit alpha-3 [Lamellibrachia satsuma]|nr:Glycine receptor subunit alpha-3 [Lamellibrachia satsuma]